MPWLEASLMRRVTSDDGVQADILIVEPTGEEHQIRCLCRHNGATDLGEHVEPGHLEHLKGRYGPQVLLALTRHVTLTATASGN